MSVPLAKIGDLCEQIRGVTYGKEDALKEAKEKYLPILRANNITESGIYLNDFVYIPSSLVKEKQKIRKNDILIAASSGSIDVVGKAASALEDFQGGFGAFCKVLRPNNKVDPRYFANFFQTKKYRKTISSLAAGANINNLKAEHIDNLLIPLPSIDEQLRIAAILDRAEALRAKRREAIAKLDQLLQSVFLEMFGGKDFPEMTVEELALARKGSIRTGPFGSQLLHSEFTDHGIKVLGIDNAVKNTFSQGEGRYISLEKYESLKRYTVYPGDVIITIMGTCGRCAVVPENIEKSINTKHLCCITLDNKKCKPEYLHSYFLMHPSARKYLQDRSKGAIMDGLNMGIVKEMPILCPPIDLQEKYCSFKSKIQKQREKLISFEIELENLNKSLQHKYFS